MAHSGGLMTELTLELLRAELAPLSTQLATQGAEIAAQGAELRLVRVRVDGLPLIGLAIEELRHDVRTLRAAINDMARVNITAGEAAALHTDMDRM
jgi:hypothetical protein